MKYTVYQVTNRINGKVYVGCHKTVDLNDGYMGSGKVLKRAINKYGIDNFDKKILAVFDTPEAMFEMEAKLVNPGDPNSYNIKNGGSGGFDYINKSKLNIHKKTVRTPLSEKHKKKISRALMGNKNSPGIKFAFKGKKHTEETKRLISKLNSINQKGIKNSQYGTMWITNERESKKILKTDSIPEGWRKGRKQNSMKNARSSRS